jgi:hypothetical protein
MTSLELEGFYPVNRLRGNDLSSEKDFWRKYALRHVAVIVWINPKLFTGSRFTVKMASFFELMSVNVFSPAKCRDCDL